MVMYLKNYFCLSGWLLLSRYPYCLSYLLLIYKYRFYCLCGLHTELYFLVPGMWQSPYFSRALSRYLVISTASWVILGECLRHFTRTSLTSTCLSNTRKPSIQGHQPGWEVWKRCAMVNGARLVTMPLC